MLGPVLECDRGRKCLVLDLDETLVHSSFRPVPNPDYILPVEIEGIIHSVYVCKRPGCDEFLYRTGQLYEVVIFTASLSKVRRGRGLPAAPFSRAGHCAPLSLRASRSTRTRCWTSWTSTTSCGRASSARRACTTRAAS